MVERKSGWLNPLPHVFLWLFCCFKKNASMVNTEVYGQLIAMCNAKGVVLVAVSKTKPVEELMALYQLGQRDFGENYVQELVEKQAALPQDIRWHFIGHLQSNKVKQIAPFVHLIHSIDSAKLLQEVNKQGAKLNRKIDCLLQMHIAQEETKYGMDADEIATVMQEKDTFPSVFVKGLMGMASFTDNTEQVNAEFKKLKAVYDKCFQSPSILSMGMSGDYELAIQQGSNMIRVGSLLFGARK
jgi:PLP dependent protein